MGPLEFAVWDGFGAHQMATSPMAADRWSRGAPDGASPLAWAESNNEGGKNV